MMFWQIDSPSPVPPGFVVKNGVTCPHLSYHSLG